MYCVDKSKAKVTITWSSGVIEVVESDNPWVTVDGVPGYSYSIKFRHEVAPNPDNFQDTYEKTLSLGVLDEPVSYTISGNGSKNVDLIIISGSSPKSTTVQLARNTSYSSIFSNFQLLKGDLLTTVTVTDKDSRKTVRQQKGTAEWVVTCDDDCPPGHIKCKHPAYPGFCCIPCQATASKIRSLAVKAGRCNCG